MTGPILDSPWMTVLEVANYARSSRSEVLAALNDGTLHGSQLRKNGRWRIHRDDVDAWLRGEPAPERRPQRYTSSRRAS